MSKKVEKSLNRLSVVQSILAEDDIPDFQKEKKIENFYRLQPSFYFGIAIGTALLTLAIVAMFNPKFLKAK